MVSHDIVISVGYRDNDFSAIEFFPNRTCHPTLLTNDIFILALMRSSSVMSKALMMVSTFLLFVLIKMKLLNNVTFQRNVSFLLLQNLIIPSLINPMMMNRIGLTVLQILQLEKNMRINLFEPFWS